MFNFFKKKRLVSLPCEKTNYCDSDFSSTKFIWGIVSGADISGRCVASDRTMNYFDIWYNKKNGLYYMDFETCLMFEDEAKGEKNYIKCLFNTTTNWMVENGYNTSKETDLYEIFTDGVNVNSGFATIEDLYAYFKFLVRGFGVI